MILAGRAPEVEGRRRGPEAAAQRAPEVAWTIVPVLILVAWPSRRSEADQDRGHAGSELTMATGYQWRWQYEYPAGSRVLQPPRPREQRRPAEGFGHRPRQRRQLPAGSRPAAGRPDRRQGPRPADRQRRDPRLVGARLRHEARRHPRHHQRDVVPVTPTARHLPRPVRGAVRRGPRLHADRRRREAAGGVRRLARRAASGGRAGSSRATE